jgi:beta-glucosidase
MALGLAACSAMPSVGKITSVFSGPEAEAGNKPATVALNSPVKSAPQAAAISPSDLAASNDVHPEIWPLNPPAPRDPAVEAQVARLLGQMTLEEKIGQMLQPDLKSVTPQDVTRYHLGSVLNGGSSAPHMDLRAPPQDWLALADQFYAASMAVPSGHAAIPITWGIDAVHGHGHIIGATLFPQNIGLGAMRDPDLVRKIGEITAQEIRVTGQDWTFAPTIAVVRDDRWGRTYEGYSEDPAVVTENAAAMVQGLQGTPGTPDFLQNGHVLASIKHFIGDGATDNGINTGNSSYSEPGVRDLLAPPYEAAIKAGAQNVMVSYSSWRGVRMHARKGLIDDVLFGRMGFDGFVISDYNGVADIPGCTAMNCPQSVNAGIDMIMMGDGWKQLYANLIDQVKSGQIPMSRIDEAVARILRVKLRSGVMTEGKPSARPFAGHFELLGSLDHREAARQAVRESLVLLKNDGGLLPLSPRAHVLVAGDGAQNMGKQTGGWTITWQGTGTTRADFPHATTIYEGIKANVESNGGIVEYSQDGGFRDRPDVAIVVFGEGPYAEGTGDINTLEYQPGDKRDLKLLQRLQAQGIPVVAVFLSGRPLYVTPEVNASNAFVAAWQPGSEGEGVADLLFSKPDGSVAYDFRGKLSFSWPRSPDQTPLNVGSEPYYPLFAFGYGLTYATPQNLGKLAEATTSPVIDRTIVLQNGAPAPTWSAAVVPGTNLMSARPLFGTASTQGLSVRQSGTGSLSATWSGTTPASFVVYVPPGDFMRQRDVSLLMNVKVDSTPTGPVTLAMTCGPQCGGRLNATAMMRDAEGKGWTTLSVPLSCFRNAGTDLSKLAAPFVVTSRGSFSMALQSVRMARSTDTATCEATPPATAADDVYSAPVRTTAEGVPAKKPVHVRKATSGHHHSVHSRRKHR